MGKLPPTVSVEYLFRQAWADPNYQLFSIELDHVVKASSLPFQHKDPFDRLLVAQSLVEDIKVVCNDTAFDAYGAKRIW